jgi:hypothetical protein
MSDDENNTRNNRNNNEDIPAQIVLLQNDTLSTLRIAGIFLVLSVAIFSYTAAGKYFAIFSLLLSLALFALAVFNYFYKRQQFAAKGYYPTLMTDIIVLITVFVILLNIWMIYEVWRTKPSNIGEIAEQIQNEVSNANKVNAQIIQSNLTAIKENRRLITKAAEALGFPADEVSPSPSSSFNTQEGKGSTSNILGRADDIGSRMQQAIYTHDIINQSLKTTGQLKDLNKTKGIQMGAVLAAVA